MHAALKQRDELLQTQSSGSGSRQCADGEEVRGIGTVSDAILGQGLRGDMEATSRTIKGLTWQRGFTNMAQGIANAEIL